MRRKGLDPAQRRTVALGAAALQIALAGNRTSNRPVNGLLGLEQFDHEELAGAALGLGLAGEVHAGAVVLGAGQLHERLSPAAHRITMAGMRQQSLATAVVELLRGAGVEALVFKGRPTSEATRANPFSRGSSDIDVLVRPQDVLRAASAMVDDGATISPTVPVLRDDWRFAPYLKYSYEIALVWRGATIDLHWHLGHTRSLLPTAEEALGRARPSVVSGIPTLAPRDALVHSALHWRYNEFRSLKYVLDVVGFAATVGAAGEPGLEWPGPVVNTVALAEWAATAGDWSEVPTGGVTARDWWGFVRAVFHPAPPNERRLVNRLRAVATIARTAPAWEDRRQLPLRATVGPVTRAADRWVWRDAGGGSG